MGGVGKPLHDPAQLLAQRDQVLPQLPDLALDRGPRAVPSIDGRGGRERRRRELPLGGALDRHGRGRPEVDVRLAAQFRGAVLVALGQGLGGAYGEAPVIDALLSAGSGQASFTRPAHCSRRPGSQSRELAALDFRAPPRAGSFELARLKQVSADRS